MPKRTDIRRILLIGPGPIVIGQACEFDYSGTQACKALKEEGFQVVLLNSNPATIMTDPDLADQTYVEPITREVVERILECERPDALLPTMGGQTALNITMELSDQGVLQKFGVQLLGASREAIMKAEDRETFKQTMLRIGLNVPASGSISSRDDAMRLIDHIGFPAIIRPSFTLGGTGGNIAYNREEFDRIVEWALTASPTGQALIEQSLIGLKEFELEVMRDSKDNVVIVCSIENFDAMGIHTGDSITVAPAMTLTDKEYQRMRDAAIRIIREIGVDTGGSNIQFAVHPQTGEQMVIEMNPRVSRSSALASKATGFPIAKIAAKLAVGYTLDEITNDITKVTKASFEPTIDYVVVKIPRFTFEKFSGTDPTLTTHMKSVGEAMALGATFKEALHKAIRSLEIDRCGLESLQELDGHNPQMAPDPQKLARIQTTLQIPTADRLWHLADAFRLGLSIEALHAITHIDPWFLEQIRQLVDYEYSLSSYALSPSKTETIGLPPDILLKAKQQGFADKRIANLLGCSAETIRSCRMTALPDNPAIYKRVDTCGAEFEALTPYLYSTYGRQCEARPSNRKKVIILGGGPNRIGQGIEFDYCCVHAAMALREEEIETIMVNCNPETVSTDYDISDRLYFEPLTQEDVCHIVEKEQPFGVVVQFGGQTPLKLSAPLAERGIPVLGTSPDSIDRAEDRKRFSDLINELGLRQPQNGSARSHHEAHLIAVNIGYPIMVRPSYVLGGRAMRIIYDSDSLDRYLEANAREFSEHPLLIDHYLEEAIEIDVDAIADGHDVVVAGIMEHVEKAGIHSGDSACSLPPYSLGNNIIENIRRQTVELAKAFQVVGLMNIQFAVQQNDIYILEVNPRASRTIPFVSKTIGVPLAKLAMKVMVGKTLKDLRFTDTPSLSHLAVKEAVFPFTKLGVQDVLLGPEMLSTGEVMGIDQDFGWAFAKAQSAAGLPLPRIGTALLSLRDADKPATVELARRLVRLGFTLQATRGTAAFLDQQGVTAEPVYKVTEGRPDIVDYIKNRRIVMVVNTVGDTAAQADSAPIRKEALYHQVPYFTTIQGAKAAITALEAVAQRALRVCSIQKYQKKTTTCREDVS